MTFVFIAFTSCGRQIDITQPLDEPIPTNPHPLTEALSNYLAGNIVIYNPYILYPEVHRISGEIRVAELVTLDDIGTLGVLLELDDGVMSKVLLYIYNDELLYSLQGWSHHGAFGAGRYNRLMSDMNGHVNIYTLGAGRQVVSTSWVDASGTDGISFRFNGQYVAEDEFNTLVEYAKVRYGMEGAWGDRFDRDDQTMQILDMTIDCVPALLTNE